MSLDQTYHPATFYPVEGVDDVIPIEDGQETVHGYYGVSRSRPNVFPKNAPRVLNGANERILVGIVHHQSKRSRVDSFQCFGQEPSPFSRVTNAPPLSTRP
jgi:hypothetical protein